MLVVAIAIAGLAFGRDAVRGEIVGQIQGLVGREGALAVQAMLLGAEFTRNWVERFEGKPAPMSHATRDPSPPLVRG